MSENGVVSCPPSTPTIDSVAESGIPLGAGSLEAGSAAVCPVCDQGPGTAGLTALWGPILSRCREGLLLFLVLRARGFQPLNLENVSLRVSSIFLSV